MFTKIFWLVSSAGFILFITLFLMVLADFFKTGPEGPLGALVLLIPPVILLIMAVIVWLSGSETVAKVCLGIIALFLSPILTGPIRAKFRDNAANSLRQGDNSFSGPQRELAHAILAGDLAKVRKQIPLAGDISKPYGEGETLLRFAVMNVGTGSTIEIVQALLGAGADPNVLAFQSSSPLDMAIFHGPPLVEILLKAGADPKRLDGVGRPLWWNSISHLNDLSLLRVFLSHGVDLNVRNADGSVVGFAAYHKNWPALWLLMESGAPWKGEKQFDEEVKAMLQRDYEYRKAAKDEIPEEMTLALKKMEEN
jgi:hypothetical protein